MKKMVLIISLDVQQNKFNIMKKYQLIITPEENRTDVYCSVIYAYNDPIVFMSKDREKAIVYTKKELEKAKEHFENCGINVIEKEVLISHKRTFDLKNDARF